MQVRSGNTKLPIETGKWFNIPRENRICKLCNSKDIGDEFHYLLKCTDAVIQSSRIQNLSKYYQSNPNVIKFENLFNVTKKKELIKICKFLDTIIERVNSPG